MILTIVFLVFVVLLIVGLVALLPVKYTEEELEPKL